MKVFRVLLIVFGISFCTSTNQSQARPFAFFNYQTQFDGSDLVVIATPTAKTTDTNERSLDFGVSRTNKDGKQVRAQSIGVETVFRVSVVLKGDNTLKKFTLHHYRVDLPETVI